MITNLLHSLNQAYDISAYAIKPCGPVWQINSAKGCFALKKTSGPAEKLFHLSDLLSRIKEAGFISLTLPLISKERLPYFTFKNSYYQLFRWYQGKHPSFTDPNLTGKCAQLLGKLHRISQSVIKAEDCRFSDYFIVLEKRTAFLERTISTLQNAAPLNRVDRSILNWGNYFLDQARYSLAGLVGRFDREWPFQNTPIGFCHNDPAPRNIIIGNAQWFLIDFELSDCDLLVKEVVKFGSRVLKANHWGQSSIEPALNGYARERQLTEGERALLPYLFYFPHDFWRLCSQRFEEKLKWSERRFSARLWEIIDGEKLRLRFLQSYFSDLS